MKDADRGSRDDDWAGTGRTTSYRCDPEMADVFRIGFLSGVVSTGYHKWGEHLENPSRCLTRLAEVIHPNSFIVLRDMLAQLTHLQAELFPSPHRDDVLDYFTYVEDARWQRLSDDFADAAGRAFPPSSTYYCWFECGRHLGDWADQYVRDCGPCYRREGVKGCRLPANVSCDVGWFQQSVLELPPEFLLEAPWLESLAKAKLRKYSAVRLSRLLENPKPDTELHEYENYQIQLRELFEKVFYEIHYLVPVDSEPEPGDKRDSQSAERQDAGQGGRSPSGLKESEATPVYQAKAVEELSHVDLPSIGTSEELASAVQPAAADGTGKKTGGEAAVRDVARFPSPKDLKWSEVTIVFVSNDSLKIMARGITKTYTFAEIGFKDRRKGDRPDTRWGVLRELARYSGRIAGDTKGAGPDPKRKRIKAISILRKRLREIMGLSEGPFYNYRKMHGYVTKFKLEDKSYNK